MRDARYHVVLEISAKEPEEARAKAANGGKVVTIYKSEGEMNSSKLSETADRYMRARVALRALEITKTLTPENAIRVFAYEFEGLMSL